MRCHRMSVLLAVLLAASLGVAPLASASRVIAPPGNAGVGQYVEVVPGAGGSTPVGSHSSHGPVLTAAQRQRLEASGSSGRALAAFAQRTGVAHSHTSLDASSGSGRSGKGGQRGTAGGSAEAGMSHSLPAAVDSATRSAGGGLGWGLFAAIGGIALAAAGLAVARRRAA